jgi:hypothetical protein
MILIRFILVGVAVYLIVRSLSGYNKEGDTSVRKPDMGNKSTTNNKKVSKEIGDYIDYEEIKK